MANIGDTFRIGEICPESGVYRLKEKKCGSGSYDHEDGQREIPLTKGEKFPPCKNCKAEVFWELVRKA